LYLIYCVLIDIIGGVFLILVVLFCKNEEEIIGQYFLKIDMDILKFYDDNRNKKNEPSIVVQP
jgi:hypothetical protein